MESDTDKMSNALTLMKEAVRKIKDHEEDRRLLMNSPCIDVTVRTTDTSIFYSNKDFSETLDFFKENIIRRLDVKIIELKKQLHELSKEFEIKD